jgi:hypothetical protein
MNRCPSHTSLPPKRRALVATLWALPMLVASLCAHAQSNVRQFPPAAERGTMVVTYPPIIQMDGKPDRLSPGARIRGTNSMLVLSGSIVGQSLVVNYVREPLGLVHEVWILTPEEAARKLPTQR